MSDELMRPIGTARPRRPAAGCQAAARRRARRLTSLPRPPAHGGPPPNRNSFLSPASLGFVRAPCAPSTSVRRPPRGSRRLAFCAAAALVPTPGCLCLRLLRPPSRVFPFAAPTRRPILEAPGHQTNPNACPQPLARSLPRSAAVSRTFSPLQLDKRKPVPTPSSGCLMHPAQSAIDVIPLILSVVSRGGRGGRGVRGGCVGGGTALQLGQRKVLWELLA